MAGRRLHLQRHELQNVNYQYLGAFRLRVDVTDPTGSGADPNVFLYHRKPPTVLETVDDVFQTIASPVDMSEYPVGDVSDETTYPMLRADFIELDFRSVQLAEDAWIIVVREVDALLKILDRMELLVPTIGVFVGADESEGDSSSSSIGESQSG